MSRLREAEELELALALSLSEAQTLAPVPPPPTHALPPERRRQEPQLTGGRAPRETAAPTIVAPSAAGSASSFPESLLNSVFGSSCSSCGRPCWFERITANGRTFCRSCLRCSGCGEPIEGQFMSRGDELFCQTCALTVFCSACAVCGSPLFGAHLKNPFFDAEAYCVEHQADRPPCFSW